MDSRFSPPLYWDFRPAGFEIPMITGASATSRIRIMTGRANAIALTAKRAALPRQTASEFAANFRIRGTDYLCSNLPALREV